MYLKYTNQNRRDNVAGGSHQKYQTDNNGSEIRYDQQNSGSAARERKAGPTPPAYSLFGKGKLCWRKDRRLLLMASFLLFKDMREKLLYL